MKSKFGKYKAKEVDEYILSLKGEYENRIAEMSAKIKSLEEENALMSEKIAKFEEKEGVIAQVMINATKHAKEIEDDCRMRAQKSDEACKKLNDEWISGMQSAQANLQAIREEAKNILEKIDTEFSSLCSWADNRLESLENASLPSKSETIEDEIISGADTSLDEICKEMGYSENEEK